MLGELSSLGQNPRDRASQGQRELTSFRSSTRKIQITVALGAKDNVDGFLEANMF